MNQTDDMRYFVFSSEQMRLRTSIEKELGRTFVAGTVYINGVPNKFTEIIKDINSFRYSDVVIVHYGDLNETNYVLPN